MDRWQDVLEIRRGRLECGVALGLVRLVIATTIIIDSPIMISSEAWLVWIILD